MVPRGDSSHCLRTGSRRHPSCRHRNRPTFRGELPKLRPVRSTQCVVGLTGGTGVGKSTVAALLGAKGAVIVDCDQLGRDVVATGGSALPEIFERFGPTVAATDGGLDRAALANIVFNDDQALTDLNGITHPAIDDLISAAIEESRSEDMVVLDMAVLVETQLGAGQYNVVVVVEAETERRLERLAERGMGREDAKARIASQASDEERRAVADHVLINNGSLDELSSEVDQLWDQLREG